MPDGIQILGVYTHLTDCEEEDGENKSCLRSNLYQTIPLFASLQQDFIFKVEISEIILIF